MPRPTLPLQPAFHPPPRLRILYLLKKIREPGAEIEIWDIFLVSVADGCGFEAQAVWVEGGS
jgi:hypothetical protein